VLTSLLHRMAERMINISLMSHNQVTISSMGGKHTPGRAAADTLQDIRYGVHYG
jgi:hypothetical protein